MPNFEKGKYWPPKCYNRTSEILTEKYAEEHKIKLFDILGAKNDLKFIFTTVDDNYTTEDGDYIKEENEYYIFESKEQSPVFRRKILDENVFSPMSKRVDNYGYSKPNEGKDDFSGRCSNMEDIVHGESIISYYNKRVTIPIFVFIVASCLYQAFG